MRAPRLPLQLMAAAAIALAGLGLVQAQNSPQMTQVVPGTTLSFTQSAQASLAVTNASARVAIPTGGGGRENYAYICNTGIAVAWASFGGNTVTAVASSGAAIPPNQCIWPAVTTGQLPGFVAGITASGTANLVVIVGFVNQPQLGNYDVTVLTLTAQAAGTINSQDQVNFNGVGANCLLNVTATTGSPSYTMAIQGKDTTSGTYYDVVRNTPAATSGNINVTTFPGQPISFAAQLARESFPLPRTWRIQIALGGTTPTMTATVGCSVLL